MWACQDVYWFGIKKKINKHKSRKNIGMTKAFQFFSRQFIQSHVNATVKKLFKHHFTSYVQYVYLS